MQVPSSHRVAPDGAYESLPVPVLHVDPQRRVTPNAAWSALGGSWSEGSTDRAWLGAIHPRDRDRVSLDVQRCRRGGVQSTLEVQDEAERWFELRISPDPSGTGALFVVALDVTEQKGRELRLRFRAAHDDLTGLLNRYAFLDHTEAALKRLRRVPSVIGVLFVDLDDFKGFNDRFGHATGDRVLSTVASRFQKAIRETDLLGRFGGDEFVVLCDPLRRPADARQVARRLLGALGSPLVVSRRSTVQVKASVGIACSKDPSESALDLIARADQALYEAKRGERSGGIAFPDSRGDTSALLDGQGSRDNV